MADYVIYKSIQVKRANASTWTDLDPVLLAGEMGWEKDTNYLKIGDGTTAWTSLPYFGGSGGAVSSVNGNSGIVVLDPDDLNDTSTTHKFVTAADITKLANLSGTNTGDQDISGIAINANNIQSLQTVTTSHASSISTLQAGQITQNNAIALNTAKQSYPFADAQKVSNLPSNQNSINSNIETRVALNDAKISYPGFPSAQNVSLSPVINSQTNVQSSLEDHETRIQGLAAGGSDGVITNVSLTGTNLNFVGSGGGFDGTVSLSSIAGNLASTNQTLGGARTITLDGNTLTVIGSGGNVVFAVDGSVTDQMPHTFENDVIIEDRVKVESTSTGYWDVTGKPATVPTGFTDGDLAIIYDSGAGGANEAEYTLNRTGTPTLTTDLTDKAYVDAAVAGGVGATPDADEVAITDAGGYFTGTNVESALQELGLSVGGGISSANQNAIDNARDFHINTHTANQTINSVATYITRTDSGNENKKVINLVRGTNDVDYTLTDIGDIGQVVIIKNIGTGTVRLIADDTETFIGEGNTDQNFEGTEDTAIIPQYSQVIATKIAANEWLLDGFYDTIESQAALYTGANAIDPNNEVNGLANINTGTHSIGAATTTVSTVQKSNGTYSLRAVNTSGSQKNVYIPLQNVASGETVTNLQVDIWLDSTSTGVVYVWLPTDNNVGGGWAVEQYQTVSTATSNQWVTYTFPSNVTAASTPYLVINMNNNSSLYLDNIRYTKS